MNCTRELKSLTKEDRSGAGLRRVLWGITVLLLCTVLLCACTTKQLPQHHEDTANGIKDNITFAEAQDETDWVKLEMKDGGIMLIELYPETAPITVANFKKLVKEGYYNGLIFHRVVENFVIQTGDPTGTGSGGSSEKIFGEFGVNGYSNSLSHTRGVISMARLGNDCNSASSQFFICHVDYPSLDGQYAAFGKVIAGLDVLDKIASVKVNGKSKPVEDQQISSIKFVNITK